MKNKRIAFVIACVATVAGTAKGQSTDMQRLDDFAAKYITGLRTSAHEQAYVVTDKTVYSAGDVIWFNVFLFNSVTQKPQSSSRYLFVDLVNEEDKVAAHVLLDAANGQLNSKITIPDSLNTGYYLLRAYTNRMRLHDSDYMSVQPLYISGLEGTTMHRKQKTTAPNANPRLDFYPEGGNIITGIECSVTVHATLSDGTPVETDVSLIDNKNKIVTTCTTNKAGWGKFGFEPSGFKQYRAIIHWKGSDISYPVQGSDYFKGQLSVKNDDGNLAFRVLLGDSIYTDNKQSYVIGVSKDSLVFAGIGKGQYMVNIGQNTLPPGITRFYLFDGNFNKLSERAVYIKNNNVQMQLNADKTSATTGEKINLSFAVTDANNKPIPSWLSVTVSDSLFNNEQYTCLARNNIGYRNMPFEIVLALDTCTAYDDMDMIMTSLDDSKLFGTGAAIFPASDDSLLFISGKLSDKGNESANGKIVTLISNAGSAGTFLTDTTDASGTFIFPLEMYPDNTSFAIQVKNDNRVVNMPLQTNSFVFPAFKTPAAFRNNFFEIKNSIRNRLNIYDEDILSDKKTGKSLPPVSIKDDRKEGDYDVSKRVSSYSSILSAKQLDGRTSVDNAILTVSGLQLMNGYLVIHGLNSLGAPGPNSEPMVLVDGAQVSLSSDGAAGIISPVLGFLHSLNPKDIDFIEVLKDGQAANYGVRGANGVILINLTNKARQLDNPDNYMTVFKATGVTNPAVFPLMIKDTKQKKKEPLPDYRSTVFWNGNYITDNTGNASCSFYTSDVPSTYKVTITGITARGDFVYKTITVKSK